MAHCWKLLATAGQEAESVGQQAMRVPCIALLTLDWRRACTTFKVCLVHIDRPAVAAEQGLGCHDLFLFVVRMCGCVLGLLVDVVSGLFKSQVGKPASWGRVLGNGADGGASVSRCLAINWTVCVCGSVSGVIVVHQHAWQQCKSCLALLSCMLNAAERADTAWAVRRTKSSSVRVQDTHAWVMGVWSEGRCQVCHGWPSGRRIEDGQMTKRLGGQTGGAGQAVRGLVVVRVQHAHRMQDRADHVVLHNRHLIAATSVIDILHGGTAQGCSVVTPFKTNGHMPV